MIRKLLSLLLALALLLPVLAFAEDGDDEEDYDDDDLEIEDLVENEYELDDDGNLILGEYHLSEE